MGLFVSSTYAGVVERWQGFCSLTSDTQVTPAVNPNMSTWQSIAIVPEDTYGISLSFSSNSASATTRNVLADIGISNDLGVTYRVLIPYLMAGHAAPRNIGSIDYYFPLFIPKGSDIAVRSQGTVATAYRMGFVFYAVPRDPQNTKWGSQVFAFGQTVATATGTTVVPTAAFTTPVALGSVTTMPLWWWQAGYTCIDTTMTANGYHINLLAGTSDIILHSAHFNVTAAEQIRNSTTLIGCEQLVPAGTQIYGQISSTSATVDSAVSIMGWGMG